MHFHFYSSCCLWLLFLHLAAAGPANAQEWQRVGDLPAAPMTALFVQGDTLYSAGIDKLYFTFDGGQHWDSTAVLALDIYQIRAIHLTQNRLFVGTLSNGVYRSDDGGRSWQDDNAGLAGLGALDISSLTTRGDSLYAGTLGAGIFVKKISADSRWSAYNNGLPWSNVECIVNVDGVLFAGAGGNATLSKQAFPGHTWSEIPFGQFDGSLNFLLDIVQQGDVLLGAGTLGLYRSTDNGNTWTRFNPGTGVIFAASLVVMGDRAIASLMKPSGLSFLKYTDDQGLSWQDFEPAAAISVGFDLAYCAGELFSARSDGLWSLNLSTPTYEPARPMAMLGPNYPNPFSAETIIPVTLLQGGWAELSIFDENGALVGTPWRGTQVAGVHEIAFHTGALPAGVYYARLTTAGGSLVQRLVVVK